MWGGAASDASTSQEFDMVYGSSHYALLLLLRTTHYCCCALRTTAATHYALLLLRTTHYCCCVLFHFCNYPSPVECWHKRVCP
jgi:hypothetical protein